MSVVQTIAAFQHFLESNNLPRSGISISIEFDDYAKAKYAYEKMMDEFYPRVSFKLPDKVSNSSMRIMDIPVKFTAKVT